MPKIKLSSINDMKLRINVVDVVSRVVTLRKAGNRFLGLCPFHNEKSPSFNVNPEKGFYKCFGCGKAGDIFSFVRDSEQLSFMEAAEALGQRFSVPLEYEEGAGPTREERSLKQEIFDLHEVAADYFHQAFKAKTPSGDFMRAYWLERRRFAMEVAEDYKIGAAPAIDDGLGALMLKRRFSEEALRQCGLFFIYDNALLSPSTLRPRFRGRLMIPIRDNQGRVVAFTARQTELTPQDDPAREAKYVNSPETPIFIKSHILFNLERARLAAGEGNPFVLVEGQLDAIRCWSVGLKTAVAPQGTAITEQQLHLLRRYHHQVECFFDSDGPGQRAALRFLPLALKTGLEARFLSLSGSEKIDPDLLFLEQGLAAYSKLKTGSLSAMAFACRAQVPDPDAASPEQKARSAQALFEMIAAAESQVLRSGFIEELSHRLRLPVSALQRDFELYLHRNNRPQPAPRATAPETSQVAPPPKDTPEEHLLLLVLHYEPLGKILSGYLPHDWIDCSGVHGLLLHRFLGEIEHGNWPGRDHLDELLESSEERALVASMLFDSPRIEDPLKIAREGLGRMRERALRPRLRKIELDLANHTADSKVDAISLLKERTELQRQLRQSIDLPEAG